MDNRWNCIRRETVAPVHTLLLIDVDVLYLDPHEQFKEFHDDQGDRTMITHT